MRNLWAPWRYEYLTAPEGPAGCIFCHAARAENDRDVLVVRRAAHNLVLLNLYPYTNGHLMIAPLAHAASPSDVDTATRAELMDLVAEMESALRAEYHPDGFNVGMNLGRSAGAGVPDHFHMHVLPRWNGDTNFMTTVGETRVLSEEIQVTWKRLRQRLQKGSGT